MSDRNARMRACPAGQACTAPQQRPQPTSALRRKPPAVAEHEAATGLKALLAACEQEAQRSVDAVGEVEDVIVSAKQVGLPAEHDDWHVVVSEGPKKCAQPRGWAVLVGDNGDLGLCRRASSVGCRR
eukprot:scaffold43864_cov59-Phaeocystis_antarctica.AAC.2